MLFKSFTAVCPCARCRPLYDVCVAPRVARRSRPAEVKPQCRPFAATAGDDLHDTRRHHEHRGPPPWPTAQHPTPYDIFHQKPGAPYQKARFYELVKLYHPDRHHQLAGHTHVHAHMRTHGLSAAVMLDRYRLIVAANDILSDPVKRRAYDLYGAGWAGRSDMRSAYREMDQSWRRRAGSAANNATWEDWDRWHKTRNGEKQEPQFMSNGGFAAIVLLFVMIGGFAQMGYVGTSSSTLLELRELQDKRISRHIRSNQQSLAPLDRKARVWNFLERREGWYDVPFSSLSLLPSLRTINEDKHRDDKDDKTDKAGNDGNDGKPNK